MQNKMSLNARSLRTHFRQLRNCLYYSMLHVALQKAVFYMLKDGLLQREMPPFGSQKAAFRKTTGRCRQSVRMTVTPRAACAPMTRACAMSAVLDGPEMKQPYP